MPIVNAKEMLLRATEGRYAVGAFNVTNLIQLEAVVETATERKAPLIIQTSVTPSKFLKPEIITAIYKTVAESAPIPICLHLDHCIEAAYCKTCADAGYTDIMINASKQDFRENIRQTKEVFVKGDILYSPCQGKRNHNICDARLDYGAVVLEDYRVE